jgi:hypothetical protein
MRRAPARHTPPQYPPYPPMPWPMYPEQRGGSVVATVSTVLMAIAALVMVGLFAWKVTGGVLPSTPNTAAQPTKAAPGNVTPRNDTGGGVQTGIDAYNAGQQATAAAASHPGAAARQAPAVQAPALPNGIPTAVILIPTALPIEQVTVVPDASKPLVFAAGSDVRPTPVTVMPYPTPLPQAIADNFEVSPDGTCITAPRGGKKYQVCQGWKYAPNELATVADLIRGGTLLGVEVQ